MNEKTNGLFCQSGGCSAKLGAGLLRHILDKIPQANDPALLVGFAGADDAAVYQLTEDLAFVQTVDFFPPMVEDPYTFGQIAAANALSDIYAMGGEVRTALNLVCFPEKMDINILGEILRGGSDKVQEAGGVVAGGHSIADAGIKYGLSVTGIVHPQKILKNTGVRPGDLLVLTKPLGVGIVTTAARVGEDSAQALPEAVASMTTLNKYAAQILQNYDIHACTDVTGFGFIGHLLEMLENTYSAFVYCDKIPYIKAAYQYAEEFLLTGAGQKNRNFAGAAVTFNLVSFAWQEILFDPQTSGGLLAAISPEHVEMLLAEFARKGIFCAVVGKITDRQQVAIVIKETEGAL